MNIKKISLLVLLSMMLPGAMRYSVAGEEKEVDRSTLNFKDEVVTEEKDFNALYPELAYGYSLIGQNFQHFMQERLLGRYSYEAAGTGTLLDNAIQEAQCLMVDQIAALFRNRFGQAVIHKRDIDEQFRNVLSFVMQYQDSFGGDILEIFKNKVNSTRFLLQVAFSNNRKILQRLINLGVNVNVQNKYGITALMCAAHNGHKEAVEILLLAGANVNLASKEGRIALMDMILDRSSESQEKLEVPSYDYYYDSDDEEIENCFLEVFQMLIDAGSDVDFVDQQGNSGLLHISRPLHYRDYSPYFIIQLIEKLIQAGANLNTQNKDGLTALMATIEDDSIDKDNTHIVEKLLEAKADVNIQDTNGLTALMIAVLNGEVESVRLLLEKKPDLNIQNQDGLTAFMYIFQDEGSMQYIPEIYEDDIIEIIKMLIEAGSKVDTLDGDGNSVLSMLSHSLLRDCSIEFFNELIAMLIKAGLDVNFKGEDDDSKSPLISAIYYRNVNIARALINAGADANILFNDDDELVTPLIQAVSNYDTENIELLISEYGADVNFKDNKGNTALMYAVLEDSVFADNDPEYDNSFEVVKILISLGADIDIVNHKDEKALDVGRPAMQQVIKDAIAQRDIVRQLAAATI